MVLYQIEKYFIKPKRSQQKENKTMREREKECQWFGEIRLSVVDWRLQWTTRTEVLHLVNCGGRLLEIYSFLVICIDWFFLGLSLTMVISCCKYLILLPFFFFFLSSDLNHKNRPQFSNLGDSTVIHAIHSSLRWMVFKVKKPS